MADPVNTVNGQTLDEFKKTGVNGAQVGEFNQTVANQNNLNSYSDPNTPGYLGVSGNSPYEVAAQINGLNMGKALTGQTIQQTGTQMQDILQKQLALSSQGVDNPMTAFMKNQRGVQMAQGAAQIQKAGVHGGAAAAGVSQIGRQADKQIAAQAAEQYRNSIMNSAKMVSNVARTQLAPAQQNEINYLAANAPQLNLNAGGNGLLSSFMDTLFG